MRARLLLSLLGLATACILPALFGARTAPVRAADGTGRTAEAAAAAACARDPFGFAEGDYSAWGIVDADYPYSGRVGCFPVGNGTVFATLGVDPDFNQLGSLTGPGYQTRDAAGAVAYWQEGDWPRMPVKLVRVHATGLPDPPCAFEEVQWETQSIQQLRGAPMVRTIQRAGELALYCMTYAPPGTGVLQRRFVLCGAGPDDNYGLSYDRSLARFDAHDNMAQGNKRLLIWGNAPVYQHDHHGLTVSRGYDQLVNGLAGISFILGYIPCSPAELYPAESGDPQADANDFYQQLSTRIGGEESIKNCYAYWQEWSSHSLRFDTGDARFDDLMAQLPVTIETQRDAASGAYSPMVNYHGCWVRDSLGPLYVNLLNQRFDTVMQMLAYHRKACWKLQNCSMLVPLDVDVSGVGEPAGAAPTAGTESRPTWDGVPVEHAEVPSLIVLQHYWLWRCMRAAGQREAADKFIAEAWPFLTHNLFTMQFDPQYGVRFHGDETYTNGALYSTFDNGQPGELGYPNGYIPTEFFSFDNTMLHRGAATAAAEMARVLGDAEAQQQAQELGALLDPILAHYQDPMSGVYAPAISPVTGQRFPTPLLNASLSPWSLGVPCKELQLGTQYGSTLYSLELLGPGPVGGMTNSGYGSTPWSGFQTGHGLATLLNAARIHRDGQWFQLMLDQFLAQATPEGAWCEVYNGDNEPVNVYGRINRIRPWESGIDYAVLAATCRDMSKLNNGSYQWSGVLRALDLLCGEQRSYSSKPYLPDSPVTWVQPEPPMTPETKLLVITRDNHYRDLLKLDPRLAGLSESEINVWDAGLPFTMESLQQTLITNNYADTTGAPRAAVPYLYLDRDVRLSDRRTFKSAQFWNSDNMQFFLDTYERHGGTVLDEAALQPSLAEGEAVGLKLLIVLYPHTFCWDMDAETVANFHKEIAKWTAWYDQVAGDKLKLELDFLQLDRRLPPRACGPQGGNVYWMGSGDVEADLLARGIPRGKYDSVCVFWAWDRETPSLPDGSPAAQAYGGAAEGPDAGMDFMGEGGRTSYYGAAVLKTYFVTTGRVALHEYLHNLDAMFTAAGMEDQFFSSDDMEAHMPLLLKERPGVFAPYGYDDAAMLELAEKSSRGEAGFPWRTQLEYYKWCLERTPKSDFAKLLKRYGARVPNAPRRVLYNSFLLPAGETPYQIAFKPGSPDTPSGRDGSDDAPPPAKGMPATGMAPITIEDVDKDGYVHWRSEALGGAPDATAPEPVRYYAEAELVAPDLAAVKLGQGAPLLRAELRDSATHAPLPGASVTASLAGQELKFTDAGDGSYSAPLPPGLAEQQDITYSAVLAGYTISPQLSRIAVTPAWTATAKLMHYEVGGAPKDTPFQPGIALNLDGPPGEYSADVSYHHELRTIEQLLAADGLFKPTADFNAQAELAPGVQSYIELDPQVWEGLFYCTGTLRVDYTAPDGTQASFTQTMPPSLSLPTILHGLDLRQLPPYIVAARHMTPVLDGQLDEWTAPPSLRLDQASGHLSGGGFKSAADGAVKLWLAYDDANLYVAADVADDQIKSGDLWGSDRLNLVFDALLDATPQAYPQGVVGHPSWRKDDYWVLLLPFLRGGDGTPGPATERLGGENPSGAGVGYFGELGGAQAKVAAGDGGYRCEWAIPLKALPYLAPQPGGCCGFTFFLSDHDAGLNELMYLTDWWGPGGIEWRFWDCGVLYFAP